MGLALSGRASTYGDYFEHKKTASGEIYTHDGFTAAILGKSNWHVLPFHTRLKLTYMARAVVIEVNDIGKGAVDGQGRNLDPQRILDLIRAAACIDPCRQGKGLRPLNPPEACLWTPVVKDGARRTGRSKPPFV